MKKNVVTPKNVTVSKKENLDSVNIYGTVKSDVSKLKETKEGINRELMYKTKFPKDDANFKSKYKSLKSSLRDKALKFANNGLIYIKTNEIEKFEKLAEEFIAFYTENYSLNDFSTESFTRKNSDKKNFETKEEFIGKVKIYLANKK